MKSSIHINRAGMDSALAVFPPTPTVCMKQRQKQTQCIQILTRTSRLGAVRTRKRCVYQTDICLRLFVVIQRPRERLEEDLGRTRSHFKLERSFRARGVHSRGGKVEEEKKMPNYALSHAQPLQTTIRSLRRSIGHPVHPTSLETFPSSITHVLLSRPTPCLALFAVLVDPSLILVNLNNESYLLPTDVLPSSDDARWAGAVNLSARSVWCDTGPALSGLRISTFGALRPRGAGAAAPSTEIIRVLVSRAGAIVTDERPDIAIVPPGLSRRGVKIQRLLAEDILCLGAGYIVDLLLRLHANPQEYLAFPEQKDLCGPLIDVNAARNGRPIPVSKAVLARSVQSNRASTLLETNPTVLRQSRRIRSRHNCDESESLKDENGPCSLSNESHMQPKPFVDGNEDAHVPQQEPCESLAKTPPITAPVRRRQQDFPRGKCRRKRIAQTRDSKDGEASRCQQTIPVATQKGIQRSMQESTNTPGRAASPRIPLSSGDKSMTTAIRIGTATKDSRRAEVDSGQQFTADADFEGSQSLGWNIGRELQPRTLISPVTPPENPPKRPRLDSVVNEESSTLQDTPRDTRLILKTPSDADTVPRRRLNFLGDESKLEECRPCSHSSRHLSDSFSSRKVDGHPFSVKDGFQFLFARLGEPLQSDIDRLLRLIRSGEEVNLENENAESNQEPALTEGKKGLSYLSNPRDAESPLLDDEDDPFPYMNNSVQKEGSLEGAAGVLPVNFTMTSEPNFSAPKPLKREVVDAFRIPVPKRRIILSNVISPGAARFNCASEISVVDGHDFDDQTCQHAVDCVDWILGADNFVNVPCDAPHANPPFSRSRKLWSSLFESNALRCLAAPGGLPGSDVRTLTGVCIRLITTGAPDDMKKKLLTQLLSVRDEQLRAGFDSLQDVLMSCRSADSSFHHKCVGAIWACLLQSCTVNRDISGALELLNISLISRVDAIFSSPKLTKSQYSLEKELSNVLRDALITSYMFSTQLDIHVYDEWKEVDAGDAVLHPENWRMIYYCIDKLCDLGRSGGYLSTVLAASNAFLRNIAVNIGGTVWPVTGTLVERASQMIGTLSSLNKKTCSCDVSSLVFENIWAYKDEMNVTTRCSSSLRTMCDSFFLIAWLFTLRGPGSPVKRAMTVIRTGSLLTQNNKNYPGVNSRFINHHVGMLMTLGDSLASSSKNGEYFFCKMLTSKCPRPAAIARGKSVQTGDQDASWRATLLGVQKRCQVLLSRQESVQHYINWLSQNLVESLALVRRSPARQSVSLSEKETMRVQDSVFRNLAILIIESLIEVNRSVLASLRTDSALLQKLKPEALTEPAKQISTYIKVCGDLISQIRSSPEESESKNRYELLGALFSLMNVQVLLVRHMIDPSLSPESGSDFSWHGCERLDEGSLSFIEDRSMETVIFQTICGSYPRGGFMSSARDVCKAAAGLLANLIELRTIHGKENIKRGENIVAILQQANMDVTAQFAPRFNRSVRLRQEMPPDIEDSYRLVFWSKVVRCTWLVDFLQQRHRFQVICVSAVLSLLVCMADNWSEEDRTTTIRLCREFTNLEPLRQHFAPIQSDIDSLDVRENSLSRVAVVEKSLRLLIKHWPVEEMRNLLQLMHSRLKGVVGSTTGIQPDGLILYSFSHTLSAQLRGFQQARVLHIPLGDIAHAVSRMSNSSRDYSKTFHMVQVRVLSALSMVPSDMETRVLVLRVVNAFPASDALSGFWGAALLPTGEVPETWTKRAEKYAQDWRKFVFISVIEDPLFAGRNVGCVVRRLAAASKGDEALRRLVQGVLVRGRGRLDFMLRGDGRAWREWSALCDELLES